MAQMLSVKLYVVYVVYSLIHSTISHFLHETALQSDSRSLQIHLSLIICCVVFSLFLFYYFINLYHPPPSAAEQLLVTNVNMSSAIRKGARDTLGRTAPLQACLVRGQPTATEMTEPAIRPKGLI